MKKGLLILLFLISMSVAYAQAEPVPIPRYSDFPLDNIHILRLQDASAAIAENVSLLEMTIEDFTMTQTEELTSMRKTLENFKRTQTSQLVGIEERLMQLEGKTGVGPRTEIPQSRFPPMLITLLSVNVLMLFIVIILIIYLRGKYVDYVHAKKEISEHVHIAPEDLVAYVKKQLKKKTRLHDIRIDLAGKGWTPSMIEHAIHAAKE